MTAGTGPPFLDSPVAGNNGPLYPKVDQYCFKEARIYEPPVLQVLPKYLPLSNQGSKAQGFRYFGGPAWPVRPESL